MRESGEMYLETIFILAKRQKLVRSIDIAKELKFSKPSVSRAVRILKNKNLILINQAGHIELTNKGRDKAQEIYEKHKVLTTFLTDIVKVSPDTAEEDACRIEHIISEDTFLGIKKYLEEKS